MGSKVYLNPLWVRVWHWIHAVVIVLLVLTGIQIRFPEGFSPFGGLKTAVTIHNWCGFVALFSFFFWFFAYLAKGQLFRQYVPSRGELGQIPFQADYYFFRYFLGDPPPFEPRPEAKFNPLQKTAYFGIMFLFMPLQIVTGLLLWDIKGFYPIIQAVGGVRVVDGVHVILAYLLTAFLITHIYLATLGHTFFSHFKAMILGYED